MDYEKITRCQLKRLKKHSDWTYRHSLRVMDHAMKIRCTLGVESQTLKELSMASRLHDIGKLAIPASILDKSDGLSEEEYRLVKCHTVYGYLLLKSMGYPPVVCEAVRAHHERYDGRGYGGRREVGILAKILCAADSYDAMGTQIKIAEKIHSRRADYVLALKGNHPPSGTAPPGSLLAAPLHCLYSWSGNTGIAARVQGHLYRNASATHKICSVPFCPTLSAPGSVSYPSSGSSVLGVPCRRTAQGTGNTG